MVQKQEHSEKMECSCFCCGTEGELCVNREPKTQVEFERALRQTSNEETSMIFSYWYSAEPKGKR